MLIGAGCASSPPPDTPPAEDAFANDRAPYATARELCAYLNNGREEGVGHKRFRGEPWRGTYHDTWTWPVKLAADAALDAEAQGEAERLAQGSAPPGRAHRDSSWRRPVWFDGVDTERLQISARDEPGDFDLAKGDAKVHAALVHANGALREGLLHHDTGGTGAVLTRIGCGGARAPDGRSRWWVVVLRP